MGATEKWLIGGPAINRMESQWLDANVIQAGRYDHRHRLSICDGQKIVRLEKAVLADGKEIRVYSQQ
jgi:hypothetical protein